jgi:hypothetical protein
LEVITLMFLLNLIFKSKIILFYLFSFLFVTAVLLFCSGFSFSCRFKFKTVTSGEFRDHFNSVLTTRLTNDLVDPSVLTNSGGKKKKKNQNKQSTEVMETNAKILTTIKELNWEELLLSPGYPSYSIDFKNSLSLAAKVLARHWNEISKDTMNKKFTPSKSDMVGWSSQQISLFLDNLLEFSQTSPFPLSILEKMGDLYGFNKSKNAEICLRWQSLCLKSNAEWIVDQVISFITSQGRMKFVRPLYRLFRLSDVGNELANTVFQKNKLMYVCSNCFFSFLIFFLSLFSLFIGTIQLQERC